MNAEIQPDLRNFEYLKSINADYIETLYESYLKDPQSIDPSWRYFFDGIYLGEVTTLVEAASAFAKGETREAVAPGASADLRLELGALKLIQFYRESGHTLARINPLADATAPVNGPALSSFGLGREDLDRTVQSSSFAGLPAMPVRALEDFLKKTYCGPLGIELAQMQTAEEREFIQGSVEKLGGNFSVSSEDKKFILKRMTESESLERFIHTRYVAQKRFSIEGGEALIPGLDAVIETATSLGASEVVLGMAHRGRLNVLINTLRKNPETLFAEFDDNYRLSTDHGEGDVKYHKGHSLDHVTRQGKAVHLSMGFNPSHLEFINPVVMGMTRAKQRQRGDSSREAVLSILMHGDAAFAGQGVVYESLQAARLEGYSVGGSIHIISNNQVGFTTDPLDSRSTRYCSDLAKAFDSPVFHANGDDPEAVWHALRIATEFRYKFKKDVFVDLVCYRRYGHNEGDEPSFTQPALYKTISGHPTPRDVYAQRLASEGVIPMDDAKLLIEQAQAPLIKALEKVRAEKPEPTYSEYQGPHWSKYHSAHDEDLFKPCKTEVSANDLITLAKKINRFPEGFKIHPKLERLFESRISTIEQGKGIDWGNAEVLSYATLIQEGIPIRMSGQDVKRGTFTHRHAAVFDFNTNTQHIALNQLHPDARISIYNSHLSETAAMGIEFGYSVSDPDSLVIWEAQFGDFSNGAQVIIDQFLATSESKWHRASGLTLLLPHGFEGQGPEHSSARLERFLQLCGKNNMTVAYPTTPAQIFHLLRRQVKRPFRKPLIVMTPKSLLRHPKAVSELSDLTDHSFHEVLDDQHFKDPRASSGVKRLMICSGKVYYELLEEREKRNANHIAIVRLEQLYPWPETQLASVIEKYGNAKEVFFVQEEPRNMGAWIHFHGMWGGALSNFGARFPKLSLTYVGREICASPAVGSKKLHDKEQQEIILKAFQD